MSFASKLRRATQSKFILAVVAFTVPTTSLYAFYQFRKLYPQWLHTEDELREQNSIHWYDLNGDENESRAPSKHPWQSRIGIQETHFWHMLIIPNLNVTGFMRLNKDELLMYNIGPLTDEVLSYLKKENIKQVYHINACSGTIDAFLLDWIKKLGTQRESEDLPKFTSFDFSIQHSQNFRKFKQLTNEELTYVKQCSSLKNLPPSISSVFQLYKATMTHLDEVILYHPLTRTLFVGCLTRHWTDRYKNTPDYNFYRFLSPSKLNKLVSPYTSSLLDDKTEFRRFINQVSDLQFKNLFMAQGALIRNEEELPEKWRSAFNDLLGSKIDPNEKL